MHHKDVIILVPLSSINHDKCLSPLLDHIGYPFAVRTEGSETMDFIVLLPLPPVYHDKALLAAVLAALSNIGNTPAIRAEHNTEDFTVLFPLYLIHYGQRHTCSGYISYPLAVGAELGATYNIVFFPCLTIHDSKLLTAYHSYVSYSFKIGARVPGIRWAGISFDGILGFTKKMLRRYSIRRNRFLLYRHYLFLCWNHT